MSFFKYFKSNFSIIILLLICLLIPELVHGAGSAESGKLPTPAEYFGHPVGADRKLVNWEKTAAYLQEMGCLSGRIKVTEVGKTTQGRPFLLVQVSSENNITSLNRLKNLQQRLYFQDHLPGQDPYQFHSKAQLQELYNKGKAVVVITCSMHATEVGAAQMSPELVYRLATDNSPKTTNVLENVILLLVANLNPDGQDLVAEWYMRHVGTPFEGGSMPWLYQAYTGHDNNRDAYMYTQQETRLLGKVLYQEWFPSICVDMHQQGSTGSRMFVMPAADPINPNVHPLIYRLNGFFGHAQGAALEANGKTGVIYNSTYTNFWQGAMGWTGWWHNQVGMLTEAASCRLATPTDQQFARLGAPPGPPISRAERRRLMSQGGPLPAPSDVQPRTNYPRPWLGGKWSLRDIIDYDYIAAMAVLETAAGMRRQLLEQIYFINQTTIAEFMAGQARKKAEGYPVVPRSVKPGSNQKGRIMPGAAGTAGTPYAVIIPAEQADPVTVVKLVKLLEKGGVIVERARSEFTTGTEQYPAGTYVIRLAQVFGRYAKDLLEPQYYPEVKRHPSLPAEPPYDASGWSLGMQMGVETHFLEQPFSVELEVIKGKPLLSGMVQGEGKIFVLSSSYNDSFSAVNRLWQHNADIKRAIAAFTIKSMQSGKKHEYPAGSWIIQGVDRPVVQAAAKELGLKIQAVNQFPDVTFIVVSKPRIALYQPWSSNADEGWTRWLLEQYGFDYSLLHNQDIRAAGSGQTDKHQVSSKVRSQWPPHVSTNAPIKVNGAPLSQHFDVLILAHQGAESIIEGSSAATMPAAYRGGIGPEGVKALKDFVKAGGTIVALGDATGLLIQEWPLAILNAAADLKIDDYFIPGSIVRIQIDPSHSMAWGMPEDSYGYFRRNPVFKLDEGFAGQQVSIPVRYPNNNLRASGWVRGEKYIAGLSAIAQVDLQAGERKLGRLVLLGLRVQNRAQTHGTFKLFFNSLFPGS